MSNPAYIVEGETEKEIIQNLCPRGTPVRTLRCNGIAVTLDIIVTKIQFHVQSMGNKNYPIVVLLDREKRSESFEQIANGVLLRLSEKFPNSKFIVGVPDQMIENWMLADPEGLKNFCDTEQYDTYDKEGKSGIFYMKRANSNYQKRTSGAAIFSSLDPSKISRNSPSFRHFIGQLDIDCWWLRRNGRET